MSDHSVQAISSSSPLDMTLIALHITLSLRHYHQSVRKRGASSEQLALIFYPILIIQRPANIKEVERMGASVCVTPLCEVAHF